MVSRWEEYKKKHGNTTPLDLLNPRTAYTDDETYENRISVCQSCEHFFKPSKQCKKCGCFMAMKAKIQLSACPLGKW